MESATYINFPPQETKLDLLRAGTICPKAQWWDKVPAEFRNNAP